MSLNFSAKNESTYELIKKGEYETILKVEWKNTLTGDRYISCSYTVRKDVEQEYGGRIVFDAIYADANTGEFDAKRINAILSTIENPKCDFNDYDELIQYLNGTLLITEIDIRKARPDKEGERDKNKINFWCHKPTKHPEYKDVESVVLVEGGKELTARTVTEISDEDLPF